LEKKIFKIFDSSFTYVPSCTLNNVSNHIIWDRSENVEQDDIVFFTDDSINQVYRINKSCKKIAWLIEPPQIKPNIYDSIKRIWNQFDLILTHQESLLEISDKFKPLPMWCSWINPHEQIIKRKTKNLSIIASSKKDTVGQSMRHEIISKFNKSLQMDLYGLGYNAIDNKSTALSDYRFSIVIENVKSDYLFTEKLIDCLVTGTIPIYWGANKIDDFFDTSGFFKFNNIEELDIIFENLSKEKYQELFPVVEKNYNIAINNVTVEDYIYKKYLLDII